MPVPSQFPPSGSHPGLPDHFACWSTGRLLGVDCGFDVFESRPRRNREGRFSYRLYTPRAGLDPVQYQDAIARVASRVSASQQICHPGLVPLVDAELDRPPFFWVEPQISQPALPDYLAATERPVSLVVWIIRQIGQLACMAHDHFRTLSGLAPHQIHVAGDGRVIVGGLHDSHHFGMPLGFQCETCDPAGCDDIPRVPVALAGPDLDVRRIGRLILWMIAQTHDDRLPRQPAVVALQLLARRASLAASGSGFAGNELTRRLLEQIMHVEIDHLLNASPFGGRSG